MNKIALITGITGQDGAFLAQLLLEKGYIVHGVRRRASFYNTKRIDHMLEPEYPGSERFFLHYGDMSDSTNLIRLLQETQPDEIYNLAAQSHVHISFDCPEYTADVDALGTLRLLEAIRILNMQKKARFYQASTSELFGRSLPPQNEETPFRPCSPYATAKLYAYWTVINFREAYNIFACNGILFNHESAIRGEAFVTRKITRAVAAIVAGKQEDLRLGNLNALRDWGHARDFVEGMWRMLQQDTPQDYVLATGRSISVREFTEIAFRLVGIPLIWKGEGVEEIGYHGQSNQPLVSVDPIYFRPTEVHNLRGDATKAHTELGWKIEHSLEDLIREMLEADLKDVGMSAALIEG
ncbi:MAG: GDP-mannose 4,6-dehydratase [Emcibacter sp.]|nr:GDP-mannose 4,6-dehydratase [Emcibacter sp.]